MGRAAVVLALVAVLAGCSGSSGDERRLAWAYARAIATDQGARTLGVAHIGSDVWRVRARKGRGDTCILIDLSRLRYKAHNDWSGWMPNVCPKR